MLNLNIEAEYKALTTREHSTYLEDKNWIHKTLWSVSLQTFKHEKAISLSNSSYP